MTERLSSGAERLDVILGGGLLRNSLNMIMGLPGSGKTILAQQYLLGTATEERPGVYLSTVSEPLGKILRYGQGLSFFDSKSVGTSVFYEDVGGRLNDDGLPGVLEHVTDLLKRRQPSILVLDSFKALHSYADNSGHYRRFLHDLAGRLSALPVTSFWVGEYGAHELSEAAEFAVADAIISLTTERTAERELRVLQVLKLRGSTFLSGKHAYRISEGGIDVFPRFADPADQPTYRLDGDRISTGISLLDGMLEEGYFQGASTLVAGPSGSGKTLMGLHFVFNGAQHGERALIATFQENPIQLERVVQGFGWSLDHPGIDVMYRAPVDIYVDEWVYELLEAVERTGARRVMVDSMGDLRAASGDEIRFREYNYSLLQRLSRQGVSLIMTQEVPELFGVTRLSEYGISHLSDNVVLLQFLRGESQVKRAVTVMKTRGSAHDPAIRQFEITGEGFELGEAFLPAQSLL
jgi:circadian clock protein KaiC